MSAGAVSRSNSPPAAKEAAAKKPAETPASDARPAPEPPAPSGPVIVGIGASAGGLNAVGDLLRHLPIDTGMAFVVVQHLDPHHESALAELLARETAMPVTELANGTVPEPNHVYVIAPNRSLVLSHGLLQLEPRAVGHASHMAIDRFFRSLADSQGARAVGVILSGGGADGVLGLQAIKAAGGITFAQDQTAVHGSMPQSAVAAGCVDFVLPPPTIAAELGRVSRHEYLNRASPAAAPKPAGAEVDVLSIIRYLQTVCGVDLELYKRSTLGRRIERRMLLRQMATTREYYDCIRKDRDELDALCREIFIHVTSFFRDKDALESLTNAAFPKLMERRPADAPIRVWVPGCSTGEEVYTLAILLLDYLDQSSQRAPIKIFATDISEAAIAAARAGIYLDSTLADVSPERQRKYFAKRDDGYQIIKSIRDMCIFARHDVTKDPPFSQLDLISCRNVMIYFGPALQQRALQAFQYGLKPGGFLLLGASESTGALSELFRTVDKRYRLYSSKVGPPRARVGLKPTITLTDEPTRPSGLPREGTGRSEVQREADRLLLAKFAPASVVVDENHQVVQFRGPTGRFLEPPQGSPTHDVLKMAREGLLVELRRALDSARQTQRHVRREGLLVKTNEHFTPVNLEVLPVTAPSSGARHFIIVFEEAAGPPVSPPEPAVREPKRGAKNKSKPGHEVERLQEELAGAKAYLQSIVEDYEARNEELKAANEEIVSSNEELQSYYEEMETAKEELQATNEELTTINDELHTRVNIAGQLNDDLANVLESINIPIAILDRDFRLRRFTPTAQWLLNLIPGDIGRPITDLRLRIDVADLSSVLREVQQTLDVKKLEVRDEAGIWYEMIIRPYKTQDQRVNGTVLTLTDIDTLKRSEIGGINARNYADSNVETAPTPLVVLDMQLRVRTVNRSFSQSYRVDSADARGRSIFELGDGGWDVPQLHELLALVRDRGKAFSNVELWLDLPNVGKRTILLTGRAMGPTAGAPPEIILLAINDLTELRRGEAMQEVRHMSIRALAAADDLAEASGNLLPNLVDGLDFEFGQVWMVDRVGGPMRCTSHYVAAEGDGEQSECDSPKATLEPGADVAGFIRQQGEPVWIANLAADPNYRQKPYVAKLKLKSAAGLPIASRGSVYGAIVLFGRHYRERAELTIRELGDLSTQIEQFIDRQHARIALQESEARLRAIVETAAEAILTVDENGAINSINQAGTTMFGYAESDALKMNIGQLIPIPFGREASAGAGALASRLQQLNRPGAEGLGRCRDGRTFPVLLAVNQVPFGADKLFAVIVRDISALKEIEARVIQNERLAVIGELSAGLAHESRNALQRSQSCLEMLQHEVREQPKAMELIDRIQKAQDYLLQLYEGVRNYAAPIHLERSRIDLAELAQTVWDDMEPTRERPGTLVVTHPDARLVVRRDEVDPHCYADAIRMGQVFRNLFENALAACGDNCEVTVSFAEDKLDGQPALSAIVEDNGSGIPADLQGRIFQPFFTTKSRGSGLGLAITMRILDAHEGTIRLDSSTEPTSRFVITLPRMRPK